jgi:iron(III) transport system permease protein
VPRAFAAGAVAFVGLAVAAAATWKLQVFTAFDAAAARAAGLPVAALTMGLLAATAIATVSSFDAVGAVLVVAMLVTPAAAAELLTRRLHRMVLVAIVLAVVGACLGYLAAWRLNTSAAGMIAVVLAMAAWASLVTRWPYNLTLTLNNYAFGEFDSDGWAAYGHSVQLAVWTAVIGTVIVFVGAYLLEKTRAFAAGRVVAQFMAMLPMAVPGLVLGLAYIFFFNAKGNPFGFLYGTMGILVINSLTHFYTVSHLTATTALKQLDHEFEAVSASLKVSLLRTMTRVTLPVCLPAVLDISIYLFVNAMTTVSAVIFLYSTDTKLAAIAIVNMDEAGFTAPAAAMAMTIVATSASVKIAHVLLTRRLERTTQGWRRR